jgi:hypothetical protein
VPVHRLTLQKRGLYTGDVDVSQDAVSSMRHAIAVVLAARN